MEKREKLKWAIPSEKEIEKAILHFLNYQVGVFAFKVDTQARFDPRIGRYLPLNKLILPGTPDIIACVNGLFAAFEVKNEKGRQSAHQKAFEEFLKSKSNGLYFIVRSVKETEEALAIVRQIR